MKKLILIFLLFSCSGFCLDKNMITSVYTDTYGGTGFFVHAQSGRIVTITNEHVCNKSSNNYINVRKENGIATNSLILKTSKGLDLCAISKSNDIALQIANNLDCPEYVFWGGHPNLGPLVMGQTYACDRVFFRKTIPGMSGSPVVNIDDQVIGVINRRDDTFKVGYMIPYPWLRLFLQDL